MTDWEKFDWTLDEINAAEGFSRMIQTITEKADEEARHERYREMGCVYCPDCGRKLR